jgi:hypothetical protein
MSASTDPASLAAFQQLGATDSSNVFHGTASAQLASCAGNTITPLTVTLPLPAGFVMCANSTVLFAIPPGFQFNPGYGQQIKIVAQSPMTTNNWSPPNIYGPIPHSICSIPAGSTYVWSVRSGNNAYSNTTLSFTLYNVLNPIQAGPSGNFYVWLGLNATQCHFVASGSTITAPPQ